MTPRQEFEDVIKKGIFELTRSKENVLFYENLFATLNDKQFLQFIQDLKDRVKRLSVVIPVGSKTPDLRELQAIGRKYGYNPFQQLLIDGQDGRPAYLTPVEFMILMVPLRRASQLLTKKISVPPHTKIRDTLTGQVTGDSKGTRVSFPEIQILAGMNAVESAIEMHKYRAGDLRGEAAMVAMLSKYGQASQEVLQNFASGVQATTALRTYLTAAMHRTNL